MANAYICDCKGVTVHISVQTLTEKGSVESGSGRKVHAKTGNTIENKIYT